MGQSTGPPTGFWSWRGRHHGETALDVVYRQNGNVVTDVGHLEHDSETC